MVDLFKLKKQVKREGMEHRHLDSLKPVFLEARNFERTFLSNTAKFYLFLKVARYSFSGSIPPKFERKLRRHKQRFGKINTTVVLDKDENLL